MGGTTVAVRGNFTQHHGGTLAMDLASAAAGRYDQLAVSGSPTPNGALTVQETGGFLSKPGDTFNIVTGFTTHSDDFSTRNLTLDARRRA
jgi:outer membrane autotransporter protein